METLVNLVGRRRGDYDSFKEFLIKEIVTDKGAYSFKGHRVLEKVVDDLDKAARIPEQIMSLLKGAQIGVSTLGIGYSAFLASQLGVNNGYFLPTDVFARRFDKTRYRSTVNKSRYLKEMINEESGGISGIDVEGLREFRGKYVYVLGLFNVANAISIPLDANLYDEVDILPEENLEWSDDRIAASDLRLRFFFSVGMLPGLGIHSKFEEGTQTLWHIKCPACGKDGQVLPDLFPLCTRKKDGEWKIVCVKCGKQIRVENDGRWVDTYPSKRKEGNISYRVSQLEIPGVALSYIMNRWEKAKKKRSKKAKFNCSALAKPDAGDMQPITEAVLVSVRGDYNISLAGSSNPRYAGVDCGDLAHFACHERLPDGRKRYIWFEEMDSDEMESRILELIERLHISGIALDSKPLRTEVRRIAYRFPEITWLQDFKETDQVKTEEGKHQGKTYQRVLVGRDASLDDFTDLFGSESGEQPKILLPQKDADSPEVLDIVDIHLKNLQKEKVTDAKGNTVNKYRKDVANHFGMAMNSSIIAEYLASPKKGTSWVYKAVTFKWL